MNELEDVLRKNFLHTSINKDYLPVILRSRKQSSLICILYCILCPKMYVRLLSAREKIIKGFKEHYSRSLTSERRFQDKDVDFVCPSFEHSLFYDNH